MSVAKLLLGRLERVDVRAFWTSDSSEFTLWIALLDNIDLPDLHGDDGHAD
jgi:hypothetical protein